MTFKETVSDETLVKLKSKGWYRHGIYRTVLLWAVELLPALGKESFALEGIERGLENSIQVGGEFFIVQKEFDDFCEIYSKKLNADGISYLKNYIEEYNKDMDTALAESQRIGAIKLPELSNSELADLFLEHSRVIWPLHHWLWSMEFLNESFDRKIRSLMVKAYPNWQDREIDVFLGKASYTFKKQFFQKEQEEIVALADSSLGSNFDTLYKKYRWLKMYFIDENPFSQEEYKKRIEGMLAKKDEILEQIEKSRHNAEDAQKLIATISDTELREYLLLMQDLSHLKTYRIDVYTLTFYYVIDLRNEIIKRLGITFQEFTDHTKAEIIEALNGVPVSKKEIAARAVKWTQIRIDGESDSYKGVEAVAAIKNAIWDESERVDELKGTTAFPGKVKGQVKVSFTSKDTDKIVQGDILVCNLTNPDYNHVFTRLAGIITDEGGVLCHSAIMAREFKIPCIIGTKIATKVLKDGDTVELDANTGIVTVIK